MRKIDSRWVELAVADGLLKLNGEKVIDTAPNSVGVAIGDKLVKGRNCYFLKRKRGRPVGAGESLPALTVYFKTEQRLKLAAEKYNITVNELRREIITRFLDSEGL